MRACIKGKQLCMGVGAEALPSLRYPDPERDLKIRAPRRLWGIIWGLYSDYYGFKRDLFSNPPREGPNGEPGSCVHVTHCNP